MGVREQSGYLSELTFQNNAFDVSFHHADVWKYDWADKRYAIISITYKLKRYSSFYVNGLVVPSLLVLFLVWLGMFIDRKAAPARTGLLVTCTLTQVALRIPVAAMLPVVDYSTWMDTFQLYSLLLTALGIIEFVIVNFLGQGGDDKVRNFFGSSAPPEDTPLLNGDNVPEVQANPLEHKAFDDYVVSLHSPVLLPMQTYCDLFARYDPDQTGSLETEEAFKQLTLACATRARLNTGDKRVDQEVRKALEQEDCDDFNSLHFIKWFEETFASVKGKGNKDDGTQSRGRRKLRRPGSSSKGGSGSGSSIEGA